MRVNVEIASRTIYMVATPIGNRGDLSQRAVAVLKSVAVIACEDTRHSKRLFEAYDIDTPLLSYHAHNEHIRAKEICRRCHEEGISVAVVSDAGTPGVNDPGHAIIVEAAAQGIAVSPVPGASAIPAALSVAQLRGDTTVYLGFMPPKSHARLRLFRTQRFRNPESLLVFFDTPHNIEKTVVDLVAFCKSHSDIDGQLQICRELTKIHEQICVLELRRLTPEIFSQQINVKGEFVCLLQFHRGPATVKTNDQTEASPSEVDLDAIYQDIAVFQSIEGLAKNVLKQFIMKKYKLNSKRAYAIIKEMRSIHV